MGDASKLFSVLWDEGFLVNLGFDDKFGVIPTINIEADFTGDTIQEAIDSLAKSLGRIVETAGK